MDENELDRMEREAIEAIERLRLEFERAAAPYVKIVSDIRSIRPRSYTMVVDGRLQTFVPIMSPHKANASLKVE